MGTLAESVVERWNDLSALTHHISSLRRSTRVSDAPRAYFEVGHVLSCVDLLKANPRAQNWESVPYSFHGHHGWLRPGCGKLSWAIGMRFVTGFEIVLGK